MSSSLVVYRQQAHDMRSATRTEAKGAEWSRIPKAMPYFRWINRLQFCLLVR